MGKIAKYEVIVTRTEEVKEGCYGDKHRNTREFNGFGCKTGKDEYQRRLLTKWKLL